MNRIAQSVKSLGAAEKLTALRPQFPHIVKTSVRKLIGRAQNQLRALQTKVGH